VDGSEPYEATTPRDGPADEEPGGLQGDFEIDVPQEFLEEDEDIVVHEEHEEAVEKAGLPSPLQPTAQEIEEHSIAHVPYRSWCEHCVRGKARTSAHPTSAGPKLEEKRATIAMDYFYLGKHDEGSLPILGVVEELTQRCFSVTLPSKGLGHQYNLAKLEKLVKVLGVQFGVVKSDTERAMVVLRDAVQAKFPNLSSENATKGESASNGLIEATIGKLEGQARTLKSALQARYGCEIGPRHVVLPWLVDYAGATLRRYQRGADGRTAYERSTRKPWRLKLPEFGEGILYQPLKGERAGSKLDPKFEKGIFLGIQEGSALKWIGTNEGVVRAWSVKRRAPEERWNLEELNHMVGLPWQLKPPVEASKKVEAGGGINLEVEYQPPEEPKNVKEKRRKGYVPRGIYIRKDVELKQFGYTENCDGCIAAEKGLGHRQHSNACKERIAEALSKTDDGRLRLELIKKREEEYIVKYQEEEEKKRKGESLANAPLKSTRVEEPSLEDLIAESGLADDLGPAGSNISGHQGGPVESTSADGPPGGVGRPSAAGIPGEPSTAMEEDVEEQGTSLPAMDIGALRVLSLGDGGTEVDEQFVACMREASFAEAMDQMADEEVAKVQLDFQRGVMSLAAAYGLTKPEVAELYSPPRVTEYGERKGVLSGYAFDLTTNDEDGNPWDFTQAGQRKKAADKIAQMEPDLLVGSPMCGPFSNLQHLNVKTEEDAEKLREKEIEGEKHLEFCVEQYEAQMERGGIFLHEHPKTARSWKKGCIKRLAERDDVFMVTADLCQYGLRSRDQFGEGSARKETTFLTNSEEMANQLSLRCTNSRQSLGIWRQYDFKLKRAGGPRMWGPKRYPVVRRVILDVKNMVVLQDLQDAANATKEEWKFEIPRHCKEVQTIFYYVKPGYTWHRHVPLTDGRARNAQVYPEGLVRAIVQGLLRHLRSKKAWVCGISVGPVNQENDIDFSLFNNSNDDDWRTFVDEVSGKPLNTAMVEKAREEELNFAERYNVWTLVPTQECWDNTGAGPIGSRWIDINKGDDKNPSYRSRLVIQEVRHSGIEAIFAATPPLESIRFLLFPATFDKREAEGHVH